MAWDWVELGPGVVAMADPLAVVTNLRLVDEEGEALPTFASLRHINGIVHQLPWQHEVGRVLEELAADPHALGLGGARLAAWPRQAH